VRAPQSSTHKKVVVRKVDRESVKGFVNPASYLGKEGVELMDLDGRRTVIPLEVVKGIYFVREFDGNSERTERKVFLSRPKMNGLWIRMTFKDAEILDGLISENLLDIGAQGYLITPPDVYSNNLKIFVPRSALESLVVLGVTSNGSRRTNGSPHRVRRSPAETSRQMRLFTAP
jgi:Family of unknown function (DUF6982)